MNVEYLDAYAKWQPLENATAVQLEPGVYEVTIAELSPTWKVSKDLFDGSLLRVNGLETNEVVGTRRDRDKIVLMARAQQPRRKNSKYR
ncbi:MAG TPA: hypothetical protein VIK01_04765 [Polyangiaceae bacterium]